LRIPYPATPPVMHAEIPAVGLFVTQGGVVEVGHGELLGLGGHDAELYRLQARGYG
jgi:hypothetical protein